MRDVALKTQPTFTVNVTLDEKKRITGVFAGDLTAAHDAAIAQAAPQALRPIPHLFDIVVVTNMGYPADLNLYQSVKAMSVAAQAVRARRRHRARRRMPRRPRRRRVRRPHAAASAHPTALLDRFE